MLENFKTKEEAEKEVKRINEKENQAGEINIQFCPLINNSCKTNCVCFYPATFSGSKESWRIYGSFCGNAMFSEYRTCQQ